jgi:hypothetical protein
MVDFFFIFGENLIERNVETREISMVRNQNIHVSTYVHFWFSRFLSDDVYTEARNFNNVTYDEKCCSTHVLSNQPDFKAQKQCLTEVVENSNCKIIFFPKYHCELNFIEMVWGWLKSYHRRSTTYNFNHLVVNLPLSPETKLPLAFVRRAAQHCFRFMQGYRHGLSGSILEYAVRKIYQSPCHSS